MRDLWDTVGFTVKINESKLVIDSVGVSSLGSDAVGPAIGIVFRGFENSYLQFIIVKSRT